MEENLTWRTNTEKAQQRLDFLRLLKNNICRDCCCSRESILTSCIGVRLTSSESLPEGQTLTQKTISCPAPLY